MKKVTKNLFGAAKIVHEKKATAECKAKASKASMNINADLRVEKRLDNLNHPCGFDVVMRVPDGFNPEHDEYLCSLPDGMSKQQEITAVLITAIPEMIDRLCDHCECCANCDWQHDPDQECRFGQLWKKVGVK